MKLNTQTNPKMRCQRLALGVPRSLLTAERYAPRTQSSITSPNTWVLKYCITPESCQLKPAAMSPNLCIAPDRKNTRATVRYLPNIPPCFKPSNRCEAKAAELFNGCRRPWCQYTLQTRQRVQITTCRCVEQASTNSCDSPPKSPKRPAFEDVPETRSPSFHVAYTQCHQDRPHPTVHTLKEQECHHTKYDGGNKSQRHLFHRHIFKAGKECNSLGRKKQRVLLRRSRKQPRRIQKDKADQRCGEIAPDIPHSRRNPAGVRVREGRHVFNLPRGVNQPTVENQRQGPPHLGDPCGRLRPSHLGISLRHRLQPPQSPGRTPHLRTPGAQQHKIGVLEHHTCQTPADQIGKQRMRKRVGG